LTALTITAGFALVEAVAGWLANSLALMGDAAHMVTDVASLGIGALAAWMSSFPPTQRHSFGLQRAEVVGALVNVLFMYLIVVGIAYAAIERLTTPVEVQAGSVVLVGALGLVVNLVVAVLLSRGEQTLNTRGALLHVIGDLLGSIAAITAGAVIWFTGWMAIDPILSLAICALILVSSTRLLLETLHVVMEGVPADIAIDEVREAMQEVDPAIVTIHDLHIWTLSSGSRALSAHVNMRHLDVWPRVLDELHHLLDTRFGIDHTTLQPEPASACVGKDCDKNHNHR
jgi:cobalt-zinc-cadmium efflux system protein